MAAESRPSPVNKAVFAKRLQAAIDRRGLTYEETARRAREHLPASARLSSVSVWQYANAKTFPRRMSYVEALSKVLEIEPDDLLSEGDAAELAQLPGAEAQSQIRLEDLGEGRARLHVDTDVPWPLALKILELLKGPMN
ncbi:MAG TPA: hypothetical protein VIL09_18000 [Microvirga sp.]|jgi:transcriptional regulator with XRE-family HTH domain